MPAAPYEVEKLLPLPDEGDPPGADHDRELTTPPLIVGEQLTVSPVFSAVGEQPTVTTFGGWPDTPVGAGVFVPPPAVGDPMADPLGEVLPEVLGESVGVGVSSISDNICVMRTSMLAAIAAADV